MFFFYLLAFLLGVDGLDRLDKSWSHGLIEIGVGVVIALSTILVTVWASRGGVDLEE
jgi:hypothetical protein